MPKKITIGPGWEEPFKDVVAETGCCTCCQPCTPTQPVALDTCPSQCCPCPPTGAICLTFYDLNSPGNCPALDGLQFQLTRAEGIPFCSGSNPDNAGLECYFPGANTGCPVCPDSDWKTYSMSLNDWPHEKWAGEGVICDGGSPGGCGSGEDVKISLCCCDTVSSASQSVAFQDECHGCRYQLRIEWRAWYNPPPGAHWSDGDMCTCPSGYYTSMDALIPPDYCAPNAANALVWEMHQTQCGSGNPDNWKTVFELHDSVWNCSCCAGGGVDTPLCNGPTDIRIIATPGTC